MDIETMRKKTKDKAEKIAQGLIEAGHDPTRINRNKKAILTKLRDDECFFAQDTNGVNQSIWVMKYRCGRQKTTDNIDCLTGYSPFCEEYQQKMVQYIANGKQSTDIEEKDRLLANKEFHKL